MCVDGFQRVLICLIFCIIMKDLVDMRGCYDSLVSVSRRLCIARTVHFISNSWNVFYNHDCYDSLLYAATMLLGFLLIIAKCSSSSFFRRGTKLQKSSKLVDKWNLWRPHFHTERPWQKQRWYFLYDIFVFVQDIFFQW